MSSFFYSDEAENVLDLFYNVDTLVYVEGPDDIPFWEQMFEKLTNLKVEIYDVGGCTALEPYINKINNGILNAIVACDSDLTFFSEDNVEHRNIIRTFGYSIENTFIYDKSLSKALRTIGKVSADKIPIENVESWLSEFHLGIKKLVKLDVYNYKEKLGKSVMVDNATRFMISDTSSDICKNKIDIYTNTIIPNLPKYDESSVDTEIVNKGLDLRYLVRGHFLFSAIARYILCFTKSLGIKTSVSNQSLYPILILSFFSTFDKQHPEYDYYSKSLTNINITT